MATLEELEKKVADLERDLSSQLAQVEDHRNWMQQLDKIMKAVGLAVYGLDDQIPLPQVPGQPEWAKRRIAAQEKLKLEQEGQL